MQVLQIYTIPPVLSSDPETDHPESPPVGRKPLNPKVALLPPRNMPTHLEVKQPLGFL